MCLSVSVFFVALQEAPAGLLRSVHLADACRDHLCDIERSLTHKTGGFPCVLSEQAITAMNDYDMKLVPSFDGTGDIVMWMKKIKLVATLKGNKDLATVIPLHLDGEAFCIYEEMSDADKTDPEKIEYALRTAFEIDRFTAYEKLQHRKWIPGEAADVYLSELRRLAKLACIENEEVLRGAFVVGLPSDVSQLLRMSAKTSSMSLNELCGKARYILAKREKRFDRNTAAAPAFARTTISEPSAPAVGRRCFICGGEHLARSCDKRVRSDRRTIICWKCGDPGHVARRCSGKVTGNGRGNSFAPVDSH